MTPIEIGLVVTLGLQLIWIAALTFALDRVAHAHGELGKALLLLLGSNNNHEKRLQSVEKKGAEA